MNTRLLLAASAIVMGAAGIAGTFAPQELAAVFGARLSGPPVLLVQLHAALLFGFAMVNWMARGSLLGGIYNRPLAVGNLAHFTIGAFAAFKAIDNADALLIGVTIVYALFAIGFGLALFRSPVESSTA